MTKKYPHEFQRFCVVVLTASQETGYAAAASIARAGSRAGRTYANRELTRPSPFSFPTSTVSEAFVVATAPSMSQELPIKVLLALFSAEVSGQVAKLD